ncbi:hypothetical protein [Paenibacillus sp. Soil750]|uniref:hypothetical protein n=1 Tax=Paenibacillus sp. Soil750 TaxID=1736398 RepID=UPI0006FD020B|nr:hypothetical protein [Paenibacillus sp. Soil750]KRE61931.1 hypothetical protein ASL11_23790 [Paenibacillus sp. Soil750]
MDDRGFGEIQKDSINPNNSGFHWRRSHGRGVNIYFVEGQSIVVIYGEIPAVKEYDVLVFGETEHINKRYFLSERRSEIIPLDERFRIQKLLVEWLASRGMRHDISVGK